MQKYEKINNYDARQGLRGKQIKNVYRKGRSLRINDHGLVQISNRVYSGNNTFDVGFYRLTKMVLDS